MSAGSQPNRCSRVDDSGSLELPFGVTSMRQMNFCTAAALVLILPALMTNATAQERKDQRGAAPAPHVAPAAPAPHVAAPAPAPHIAAPAAQPHIAAPAPHIAAPAAR